MNEIALFSVLELDSIYRVLSWEERIRIHFYLRGKLQKLTPKIEAFAQWIKANQWEAPAMKYGQDRILYYYDNLEGVWRYTDHYLTENSDTTEAIQLLNLSYNENY